MTSSSSLVSLWEMLELDFGRFATAHNAVCVFGQVVLLVAGNKQNMNLDRRGVDDLRAAAEAIVEIADRADLPISAVAGREFLVELALADQGGETVTISPASTHIRLAACIRRLQESIKAEASNKWLLGLGSRGARLWQCQEPAFGAAVDAAFPSARDDIEEAAKCLAVERGTACVMHLMRATEVPLKALAALLNIGVQNDWGSYIREIDKELGARMKNAGKRTTDEQFFAEASEAFERVKRAWRNRTMHVDQIYTVERAQLIFDATRDFMNHLAERISE